MALAAHAAGAAWSRTSAAAAARRTACRAPTTPATTRKSARCCARSRARVGPATPMLRGGRVARRQRAPQLARPRRARCRAGRSRPRRRCRCRSTSRPPASPSTAASIASTRGISCATLKPKALAMARALSGAPRRGAGARACARCGEFDDAVTAPLHGFAGTARLLAARRRPSRGSREVAVPTLVLNARNDPFVPARLAARRARKWRAR